MANSAAIEWFTSAEAARYLGVSLDTLFRLRAAGRIPCRQFSGSHPRYRRSDLERIVAEADRRAEGQGADGRG